MCRKKIPNEYIFSEPIVDWYVIVNGCENRKTLNKVNNRKFIFPENGILLVNIKNFDFTKNDVFMMNDKLFDPNSKDSKSYKLCYHMVSSNCGYKKEKFDFYFFRVAKNCNHNRIIKLDGFFDNVLDYMIDKKIKSLKSNWK